MVSVEMVLQKANVGYVCKNRFGNASTAASLGDDGDSSVQSEGAAGWVESDLDDREFARAMSRKPMLSVMMPIPKPAAAWAVSEMEDREFIRVISTQPMSNVSESGAELSQIEGCLSQMAFAQVSSNGNNADSLADNEILFQLPKNAWNVSELDDREFARVSVVSTQPTSDNRNAPMKSGLRFHPEAAWAIFELEDREFARLRFAQPTSLTDSAVDSESVLGTVVKAEAVWAVSELDDREVARAISTQLVGDKSFCGVSAVCSGNSVVRVEVGTGWATSELEDREFARTTAVLFSGDGERVPAISSRHPAAAGAWAESELEDRDFARIMSTQPTIIAARQARKLEVAAAWAVSELEERELARAIPLRPASMVNFDKSLVDGEHLFGNSNLCFEEVGDWRECELEDREFARVISAQPKAQNVGHRLRQVAAWAMSELEDRELACTAAARSSKDGDTTNCMGDGVNSTPDSDLLAGAVTDWAESELEDREFARMISTSDAIALSNPNLPVEDIAGWALSELEDREFANMMVNAVTRTCEMSLPSKSQLELVHRKIVHSEQEAVNLSQACQTISSEMQLSTFNVAYAVLAAFVLIFGMGVIANWIAPTAIIAASDLAGWVKSRRAGSSIPPGGRNALISGSEMARGRSSRARCTS